MPSGLAWLLYCLGWAAAGAIWTLVAATGARIPVGVAALYGMAAMTVAGVLGVAVRRLAHRVPWAPRSVRFLIAHAGACLVYACLYATSAVWVDVVQGRGVSALPAIVRSPTVVWNAMMGAWLYWTVAGLSYAIDAQRDAAHARESALRAQALADEARLEALRARVNPHFLFNALHSIGALISLDPVKAEEAVVRLGDLLRYVLNASALVPFREEWHFTQQYLDVERLRLGDRLAVKDSVAPPALGVLVPPLVLQPLVENAIRHGIADRARGGTLTIDASVSGDRLRFAVRDDGGGAPSRPGLGTGLSTLRERLAAHFHDGATVDVESTGAAGYGVVVTLPIRARDDEDDE